MVATLGRYASPWDAQPEVVTGSAGDPGAEFDVAVVGAGITGATTALLLARAGQRVVLVDAGNPLRGSTTVHSTGKVTIGHGATIAAIARRHDEGTAEHYVRVHAMGLATIAELARELAPAALSPADQVLLATSGSGRATLDLTLRVLRRADQLAAPISRFPLPHTAAVEIPGQYTLDPGVYLRALLTAAVAAGASLVLGVRVRGFSGRDPVVVHATPDGTVDAGLRARRVVIASHYPLTRLGVPFARLSVRRHYAVVVTTQRPVPRTMTQSLDAPTRSTRRLNPDDDHRLVVVGQGFDTGAGGGPQRWQELVDWAGERFGVREVTAHWAAQDTRSSDDLPLVGPVTVLRGDLSYAAGFGGWGLTGGTAAARVLADALTDTRSPWSGSWHPRRVGGPGGVLGLARTQAHAGLRLITGLLQPLPGTDGDPDPGQGRVVRHGLEQHAVYRDGDGTVHRLSARCPHLGCTVGFNAAERTWDCPCHGSRFAIDGSVLEGPATEPLAGR